MLGPLTHYQRLLVLIVPDRVHVLSDGRIARSGGPELALDLERSPATPNSAARRPKGSHLNGFAGPTIPHQGRAGLLSTPLHKVEKELPGAGNAWAAGLRRKAIQTFGSPRSAASPHRGLEIHRPPQPG